MKRSLLFGGFGFGLVSLFVFATVAYAEKWMYAHLGLAGAYLFWTALFILLGGTVFGLLVRGRWRLPKFYLLFGCAFFAYAIAWMAAYFVLRDGAGEWFGSIAGSILMSFVFAAGFEVISSMWRFSAILFIGNSTGYFLGSALNNAIGGTFGMLVWGLLYGVCLGAAIGIVLYWAQHQSALTGKSTA
jgi:hypothetical protein